MKAMGMLLAGIALLAANQPATVCAETETIDGASDAINLKALAKKARPAVMLLVVSDANGKEIATGTGFLVSSDGKPKRSEDAAVSFLPQLITNFHVIEKAASAVIGSPLGLEGTLSEGIMLAVRKLTSEARVLQVLPKAFRNTLL